jgi:hypothetical protein
MVIVREFPNQQSISNATLGPRPFLLRAFYFVTGINPPPSLVRTACGGCSLYNQKLPS